jgi:hypothetical protein
MPESKAVSVLLAQDEALILFELVVRLKDAGNLLLGEREVLDAVECQFERVLAEPFLSNYPKVVAAARSRLASRNAD